jgi:hypothetical protein
MTFYSLVVTGIEYTLVSSLSCMYHSVLCESHVKLLTKMCFVMFRNEEFSRTKFCVMLCKISSEHITCHEYFLMNIHIHFICPYLTYIYNQENTVELSK